MILRFFHLALFIGFALKLGAQAPGSDVKNMLLIPSGKYTPMYSSDKLTVKVESFMIDKYAVTNNDYSTFVKEHPNWRRSNIKKLFADKLYLIQWKSDLIYPETIANSPVVNISWFAAQKYCECQGKRLPTTAEWEIVAQASKEKKDGSNDKEFKMLLLAMASTPTVNSLPAVGSFDKNYFGVYDMHGLVWEWTSDFNSALTTGESRGNTSLDNTLFCGGGSFSAKDVSNYAAFLRFAMRSSLKAKYTVHNVGFRCASSLKR